MITTPNNKVDPKAAYVRVLPHSLDMEKRIIGQITHPSEPEAIYTAVDILQPEDFYSTDHEVIFRAILNLFDKSHVPGIELVAEELRKMGKLEQVGGIYYLMQCQDNVTSSANLEAHCRIVKQKSICRKTIRTCEKTLSKLYEDREDVFDIIENHNEQMFINTSGLLVRHDITMSHIGYRFSQQLAVNWEGKLTGVPTGIPQIDEATNGLQPGTLGILGARNRHGKSALATAIMQYCSSVKDPDDPTKCLFPAALMSLEMKDTEVFARLLSAELSTMGYHIPYSHFKAGKKYLSEADLELINIAIERLANKQMYIDDSAELTPFTLRAKIARLIRLYGVKLVILDYAQLMTMSVNGHGQLDATAELSAIAKLCKALAKHFNISILLLSQISRETEKKDPRPPVSADLKGSGTLEDSADYIFLSWRPDVWSENPIDEETGQSDKGILYVYLAKHKMGKTEKVRVPFDVTTNSYGDMSLIEGYEKVQNYFNTRSASAAQS